MALTVRLLTGGSLIVWAAALAFSAGAPVHGSTAQTTTNDGIYTKAQADGAKKQFDKICAECHAFTVAAKKKPKDLTLGDEPFFESWTGRPVVDLVNVIVLTMPNDGSAVVSEAEAVDLVAYMLQQNGFPAGSKPLTKDSAAAVVERPKK
jgi:mono/diheme cytochrome c family protein